MVCRLDQWGFDSLHMSACLSLISRSSGPTLFRVQTGSFSTFSAPSTPATPEKHLVPFRPIHFHPLQVLPSSSRVQPD